MCQIEDCSKPVKAKGLCAGHYSRWYRHGDPLVGGEIYVYTPIKCAVEGCVSKATRKGWCNKHYKRWKTYGDVNFTKVAPKELSLSDRFWQSVDKDGPIIDSELGNCWTWNNRSTSSSGYGQIGTSTKTYLAHRISWEIHVSKIPVGIWVLHKCDNKICVRPSHLYLGTVQDNINDYLTRGRYR